jgi:fucose permease
MNNQKGKMPPVSLPDRGPEVVEQPSPSRASSTAPWITLALLFTVTVINFIDRQTVSILAPVLREVLHLSNEQYGRIVAAFSVWYDDGRISHGLADG